jgi:hypothetical protein
VTRNDERVAGGAALLTAALAGAGLYLTGAGPGTRTTDRIAQWVLEHHVEVRVGALLWLLAMLSLVVFAIRLRDALLPLGADRWWLGPLFVQGAGVFATVAVVAAATAWAAAELAGLDAEPGVVASTWTLHRALLRFATWGLIVPVLTAGVTLTRHSTTGILAAIIGGFVAVLLLVPTTWRAGVVTFVAWLVLTGVALLVVPRVSRPTPEQELEAMLRGTAEAGPEEERPEPA